MSCSYIRGALSLTKQICQSNSRRRPISCIHGFEQRPSRICIASHSLSTLETSSDDESSWLDSSHSVYDKNKDWRTWFQSPEYINAWSSDDIEPLDDAPVVDSQSRMVLDLINKLYQVGLTKTADRVTTERVHAVLQQLEDMPEESSISMWQRAERARVLLEAMEQLEELRDERGLPIPLPLPRHQTYWRVLRMYSNKYLHGSAQVPQICHAIVQRMQDSGRLELQPTAMHWNQVISAYANSTLETRPIVVVQLLYELDAKGMTDASSFSHALRACSALGAREQIATPRFMEMALPVARRIWSGLKQSESIGMDIQPFHFTHMLRVFRNITENDAKRDESASKIFNEAIEAKKVNIHVLNEFMQVASSDAVARVLGISDYPSDVERLIRMVPAEWLEDVEGGKSPFEW